ncbi:putative ribonuclease H-like domain-containing protein, partial [Tanacetum coccineum]
MTNYSLWEVIKNGNKVLKRTVGTVKQENETNPALRKTCRRNGNESKSNPLMALFSKQRPMKFHSYQDAKLLMKAIEKSTNNTNNTHKADDTAHESTQLSSTFSRRIENFILNDLEDRIFMEDGHAVNQRQEGLSKEGRSWTMNGQRLKMELEDMIGATKLKKSNQQTMIVAFNPMEALLVQILLGRFHISPCCKKDFVNLMITSGSDKGYHSVPPPLTGNFIPRKPDQTFMDEIVNTNAVRINNTSAPIIEDLNSDDESRDRFTVVRPDMEQDQVDLVNTAASKQTVNHPRSITNAFKRGSSRPFNRHFVNKNSITKTNVNDSLATPQQKEYKKNKFLTVACSRPHDRKQVLYLMNMKHYDGGFVYFWQLNLTCTLLDESQVLLRVPRKDNIYSVDLKSVVPTGGLTYLIAKAIIDESNTWHKRLGHINFKIMNKLVKGNLVKGLPSKIFENDHSCVACQKGKQHKASYKTKLVNSIRQTLNLLHMDLFSPTNVKSLMKKSYSPVVTDDFGRFSWVFFLATKDETRGIIKTFITEIVNQLDHKVKVIRSDNGTEFKNSIMNQFCEIKGIKREFSVARTPQQNGVAERKNRTLIEAARTMLVDSKLPTTFWAEAVNTACYVLNRVLVIKPHNKTPYELIRGRPPLIDFMKPFGCPVTILNTRDHLGKFDGKADEGYFVGYSVVSKAMRVFNKRTRIVEETLNIRFLENTTNVKGNGPDWLFDVDSLTISMNYVPVAAGNKTNGIAGTKDNIVAGQAQKEKEPEQEYILIPLCTTDPLISQGPKDCEGDAGMKPTEVDENEASDKSGKTVLMALILTANEFEEQLFKRFSPFKNAFSLPPVPN